MPPRPCGSHVAASAERDGPPHSGGEAPPPRSAPLTSLSLERAAARDTTLIAQQKSLPILWFSSCSSNCSCGGGSWEGSAVIMCIQQFSDGSLRRGTLRVARIVIGENPSGSRSGAIAIPQDRQ